VCTIARRGPKPSLKPLIPLTQCWDTPAHLSARAKREFERSVELLRQRSLLESVDAEMVARRAELVDIAETAYRQLKKEGPFVESDRGNLSPHPGARMHASASAEIRLIDKALGLAAPQVRSFSRPAQPSAYSQWTRLLTGSDDAPSTLPARPRATAEREDEGD
jgi:P27 family predicted phage terminase small subunit